MGVRLPPEYQETEWIEGTRNLHLIDTGIPGNRNTLIIEAKVKPGDLVQYAPLWGNYRGENYNVTRLIAYASNSILSYINTKAGGGTSAVTIPPLFETGKTFVIRQERTKLTIDGTAYTIPASVTASENSDNIAINASTTGNPSPGTYTTQRWYYFRIFDGEIILRDFIPCYRKSDMIAGMYDLVSNAFFANARTGKTSEFTAGPDVIDSISPWLVARRRGLCKPPIIPSGYTVVNKLISLGTNTSFPYIDTGIFPNSDYGFDVICETYCQFSQYVPYYGCVFGGRFASGNRDFQLTTYATGNEHGNIRWGDSADNQLQGRLESNRMMHVTMLNGVYSVDGVEVGTIQTLIKGTKSIYLFGLNNGGSAEQHGSGCAIYNAKFFDDNGVLIRNYVPVVRKADDKPGLYDTVGKQFCVNASQTSVEFTWE